MGYAFLTFVQYANRSLICRRGNNMFVDANIFYPPW